jgi:YD repeat-containing protein
VESGGRPGHRPAPAATTGYNTFGERPTKDALGNVATHRYDRNGPRGRPSRPAYNGRRADGHPVTTKYDALGNVVEVTDARGNITRSTPTTSSTGWCGTSPAPPTTSARSPRYTYTRTGQTAVHGGSDRDPHRGHLRRPRPEGHGTQIERKPVADNFTTTDRPTTTPAT